MSVSKKPGAKNSFISDLKEGFSAGLKKIGSDVLPTWTAKQLDIESKDQLAQPTFDRTSSAVPRRQDALLDSVSKAGINGSRMSPALLAAGAGVTALVLILALRR